MPRGDQKYPQWYDEVGLSAGVIEISGKCGYHHALSSKAGCATKKRHQELVCFADSRRYSRVGGYFSL
ncbi:hypothetical protein HMPREF0388_0494 [Mobiluncus curtisii ATCC 51333]|uniref:Uncharacterized protein n=1 Tax=Mobiluncus curtisii ATCC 51333 TaxID=887326 RepID=E6LWU7_9ACTO|nr:hypothetical protein HMPREF0388_0494 [Mobiluncus curtisii ATCC 51333]